jgi:hypothetical protein
MQFKESVEVKLKVKFHSFEPTMSQQQVFNNLLLSIQNKFKLYQFLCLNQTVKWIRHECHQRWNRTTRALHNVKDCVSKT